MSLGTRRSAPRLPNGLRSFAGATIPLPAHVATLKTPSGGERALGFRRGRAACSADARELLAHQHIQDARAAERGAQRDARDAVDGGFQNLADDGGIEILLALIIIGCLTFIALFLHKGSFSALFKVAFFSVIILPPSSRQCLRFSENA